MKKKKFYGRRLFAILLSLAMVLTLLPSTAFAAAETSETIVGTITGSAAIDKDGTYQVASGTSGTITVAEGVKKVTLIGNGAQWGEDYEISSTTSNNLHIDTSKASGIALTIQDMYIVNRDDSAPMIEFSGKGNTLNIEGTCLLENFGIGQGTYAAVHVNRDAGVTIGGTGTLYFYKSSGGSGFGGNKGEMNGEITFGTEGSSLTVFAKGTKQGAVIGAGAEASSTTDVPGAVRFVEGEYNLISNSRGAVIGGGAGSGGGSTGTEVYVGTKANVNINVDYSGAAVGGAGYDKGNDASGGTLHVDGGSLRVYVDKNAAANLAEGYNGEKIQEGVNDAAITARRLNSSGQKVYRCVFDTKLLETEAESFNVSDGDKSFYVGGLHQYGYIQEGLDKQVGEQLAITSTPSN